MSRYETDEEQVEAIKKWWNQNGTQLLSGVLVIVLAWSGWTFWQNTKTANAITASSIFELMQMHEKNGDLANVLRDGKMLMEEQPTSPYSTAVALMLAKYHFDKAEMDKAIENLQWVGTHSEDASLKFIAQLRLASVYVQQSNLEQAEATMKAINSATLSPAERANYDYQLAELALSQGNKASAKEAFQRVLDNEQSAGGLQNLAKLKLDDLAG